MYTRMNFCVHETSYKDCLSELEARNGKLSTIQPERDPDTAFIEVEANFVNLEDANSFIYHMFFSQGLYFYVQTMKFVASIF